MNFTEKTQKAAEFAKKAHASINEKREYSRDDYFVHPLEVAEIVKSTGAGDELICAAFLHDSIESLGPNHPFFGLDIIKAEFGEKVANWVIECTNVYTPKDYPDLTRKQRKDLEAERLGKVSKEAATIKLADIISNTRNLIKENREFAKVYFKEKLNLMGPLSHGNHYLLKVASQILVDGYRELGMEITKVGNPTPTPTLIITKPQIEVEVALL
jgi:(p)ppGpp synthase/HD superfamily hydrolase